MGKVKGFEEFVNEGLTTKDAKDTIKDIFDKFDGEVKDEYLKKVWEEDSTLRELYGKKDFDKAWDELVDDGTIETEDGKTWCWCKESKIVVEKSILDDDYDYSGWSAPLSLEDIEKGLLDELDNQKDLLGDDFEGDINDPRIKKMIKKQAQRILYNVWHEVGDTLQNSVEDILNEL
jgi:hypothetical protein